MCIVLDLDTCDDIVRLTHVVRDEYFCSLSFHNVISISQMYHNSWTYFNINGHLGFVHLRLIINTSTSIYIHVSWWTYVHFGGHLNLRVKLLVYLSSTLIC